MRRVFVVKVGTSTLTAGGKALSKRRMLELARQISVLVEAGEQIALVSSGAIAAGREALGFPKLEKTVAAKQLLSAVGQARLMQTWAEVFALFDKVVAQVLLTRGELSRRAGYLNARDTLQALLKQGIVPVINENDALATEEIRVGDNDNLSALVANLLDADTLVLLTDIEGLFDADPRSNPNAKLLSEVKALDDSIFALAGGTGTAQGTGGMRTKLEAARLAGQSGTTTVIACGEQERVLERLAAGESVGTRIHPLANRRESRARWLLAEPPVGILVVDSGAATRLKTGRASLLPIGILRVGGEFLRGDVVRVVRESEEPVAVGVAAYDAEALKKICGKPSKEIATLLGDSLGDEAIHRDDLALL
ncbi:MAG: glutamate 5-kinase [Armatimonas sp.]